MSVATGSTMPLSRPLSAEMSRNTSPSRRRAGSPKDELERPPVRWISGYASRSRRAASKNAGPASGSTPMGTTSGSTCMSASAMPLAWAAAMMSFARSMRSCASVGMATSPEQREHQRHPLAGAHVQHVQALQATRS